MPQSHAKVYLIPCVLSPHTLDVLPAYVAQTAAQLRHFFVENERSARRFLKELCPAIVIDELQLYPMNEHHPPDLSQLRRLLKEKTSLGVLSEAGYPCIADPGKEVVQTAHAAGAAVIPLSGPSSLLLALAASGMNGQNFQFTGYLPVKQEERISTLKALEKRARQLGQTQLFIETPYRNRALLEDILQHCQPATRLCIAADITGPEEFIRTRSVAEWRQHPPPDLHKRPAIFVMDAF
ncbi:SAM-dependent methyltransferase [Compostibacter hankyongensis]|uniref:SAM-dependent methyltransferase n=1 Tax=Compostibacter hankyongensis TaxID=1007089 RepID=A0ABP8FI51_9BACT